MFVRSSILPVAWVLIAATSLQAAKLKTWQVNTSAAYVGARFDHTVVSNQGTIRLARLLKPVTASHIDATHIWDMVEDKEGNLILATGSEGKLIKLTPAGAVTTLYENKNGPILSLAIAPDGNVFAGTGPDGRILRLSPKGEVKTVWEADETYIWALLYQPETNALLAATGPKGRILKMTPDGKMETFFQAKQDHFLCLAPGAAGAIYAGTDKQGLVYRIDVKGKGYALFQAPQGEVRSLLATPEALYAGTAAPTRKRGNAVASASTSSGTPATLTSHTKDSDKNAPAPTQPGAGENAVYRIDPDGSVREIFREKTLMMCLHKKDGKLLVGTGMDGRLFEVDETSREYAEIARPDVGQILKMLRRADGSLVLATGDSGHLLSLAEGVASKGTVMSDVFDAKLVSKWGTVSWRCDLPKSTTLSIAVRGGNTSEPDALWSDWSPEYTDPAKAKSSIPASRYTQFRATLASDNVQATPALHSVSLRYSTMNQAPEVTSIETPDLDAAPQKDPKKIHIKWAATDPNEDELTYEVLIRKDGWTEWVRIEEALEKTEYDWDSTTTPSGVYRIKIVAKDQIDNPDGAALSGSKESNPVLVVHEAPQVTIRVVSTEGGKATLEATASSPLARLAGANYAINGKPWKNVFPDDGLFDDKQKKFRFQAETHTGANVVVLRVKDVAGNVGSADVVFTVPVK